MNGSSIDTASSMAIPVCTHTRNLIITLHYTCCCDEFKIRSHADSLMILSCHLFEFTFPESAPSVSQPSPP